MDELASIAAYSKYHFQRTFSALFGLSVRDYQRLGRLKRAGNLLAFREELSVTDIAIGAGYDSLEAFSRAFKRTFRQTPSAFRGAPDWNTWHRETDCLETGKVSAMSDHLTAADVRIVDFPETLIAVLEHRDDPRLLGNSLRRFIEWRKAFGTPPSRSATFNLLYDNPADVAPEGFRLDIAAEVFGAVADNPHGVVARTIPAGRCAALRHLGSTDNLDETAMVLYRDWLPQSGEEVRNFPLFLQRLRFYPDVPEHEAESDIFLPIR